MAGRATVMRHDLNPVLHNVPLERGITCGPKWRLAVQRIQPRGQQRHGPCSCRITDLHGK